MKLIITVPDSRVDDVADWTDGQQYNLVVTQTGPGRYDLVSSSEAEGGGEDAAGDESDAGEAGGDMTPGSMSDTAGTTIPITNPAVAAMARKKMMA